jgi:hypothetical protein
VFGGPWVSNEMLEVAVLSTVRAEALPLATPPTLLGVVLPECESLGLGEKMFTNWRIGGDITQSAIIEMNTSCQNIILTGGTQNSSLQVLLERSQRILRF